MAISGAIRSHPLTILGGFAALTLMALFALVPPVAQPQDYHQFSDQRTMLGIPHFWNVVSNLPFVLVGAAGLRHARTDLAAGAFFAGVLLTGFGSSYYHWNPNDAGLFWDRLPMTVAFMAATAAVIEERIDRSAGLWLLAPLMLLGLASLIWWRVSGDLRLYGFVQFFPAVALPLMLWLLPPRTTGTWYWFAALGWSLRRQGAGAFWDAAIHAATGMMSGHPIKHIAAAASCYAILRAFDTRRPLASVAAT